MVHFQPSLYYRPRRALSKVLTSLSFLVLAVARGGVLDIVVHEADAPKLWRPDYLLLRWVFRLAGQVSFHTEAERAELERQYRVTVRGRLTPHQVFPPDHPTRLEARRRLEIPAGEGPVYLCAGFLHRSKGFDRAVAAFASSEGNGASLYIVGSVRDPTPDNLAYAADLAERARRTPGVTLIARFVSDEEFDLWMAAADRVVLPYRRSWSSGILARAHALGTPAVVSAVGGLAEQADEHDVVVHDDAELARAMGAAPVPGGSA
jgi:glycosyltransferase involved in cell wall biosynthesis